MGLVFEEHPLFKGPDDPNIGIWRYIDLPRYLSLLVEKALFFARADKLAEVDAFEGSLPLKAVTNLPLNIHQQHLNQIYVNSWYVGSGESTAMWKIYSENHPGIALKSSYARLRDCWQFQRQVFIGLINYIDYVEDTFPTDNAFYPLLHKQRAYSHESELRAAVENFGAGIGEPILEQQARDRPESERFLQANKWAKDGILVPVDLSVLIDAIVLAPRANQWEFDLVRKLSEHFGVRAQIRSSDLDRPPRSWVDHTHQHLDITPFLDPPSPTSK